ncbi:MULTISPECIES: hypothetical protein [Gordonia]|uniref:hypothetical protein n=1 Tax=Gordonia TaxID=2053 RepID=UPI0010F6F753|nr:MULTISPECIES: hypothetical protein [unclassified Gordonia (in: high G+C Gram-positive bacteria)]MCZ4534237.1 hypothetical protein [Gordonia terrae]
MPHRMPLAEAHERQDKVLYMRAVLGMSWRQIMREVGYTSVGATQQGYASARRRNQIPDGETTLAEILERRRSRLITSNKALAEAVRSGDHSATASLLRTQLADDTELAKLYGLHAPERHQVAVAVATTEVLDELEQKLTGVIDGEVVE